MHEVIRKIHIPQRQHTGIIEEREVFAKMEADRRAQRNRLRRDRILTVLGLRKAPSRRKRT